MQRWTSSLPRPQVLPTAALGINVFLIAKIWYDWRFSYFWTDDFNNLYWVHQESAWSMLRHVINPWSDFFRPAGMSVYWILWQAFGLNFFPYHILAWGLHALNVVLLYVLLERMTGSRFGAALGSIFFGFRANFADLYWSFGFIFELLACLLVFLALLFHCRTKRTYASVAAVIVLTVLAIKSKEMAITLPALLLAYDVTHRRAFDRKALLQFLCLTAIAIWFTYFKISTMAGAARDHPYYMDLTILTLGRGYGWYFDHLYGMRLRWGAWMIASVIVFLAMLYRRENRGTFFLAYLFISLSPVVFLVNHRTEVYWYIPFFGLAGMAAVIADAVTRRVRLWIPSAAAALGLIVLITFSWMHYSAETRKLDGDMSWRRSLSREFARFIGQLRELPQPAPDETIYYRSFPKHFSPEALVLITRGAFRRTDVRVQIVETPPPSCHYCLEYDTGTLRLSTR